ncbi:MAG: hypothetical protein WCK32_03565 [Chlorobiaceae bacterium]
MSLEQGNIFDSVSPQKKDDELEKGFAAIVVEQPKLLDELGKQLVTLTLAIPGLFATILKLTSGDKAVIPLHPLVVGAFLCWFAALICSLWSLMPRKWKVDRQIVPCQEPAAKGQPLSIEEFFLKSALYKRSRLIAASLFCFIGIACAGLSIFQ